ncbi:unnamed protein product, partial [Coccothraustes coccothraustes]
CHVSGRGPCDVMSMTCPCPQATTRCPSVPCPHCHSLGMSLSSATSQCHPCVTSQVHPGAIPVSPCHFPVPPLSRAILVPSLFRVLCHFLVPSLCAHVTSWCHFCPVPSWCHLCPVSPCHIPVPFPCHILVPSPCHVPVPFLCHPSVSPRCPSLSHPCAGSPCCPLSPVPRSCAISVSPSAISVFPSAISVSHPHVLVPPPCPLNVPLGLSVTSPGPGVTPMSHPPAMSMSLGHLPECHL